MCIHVSGQRNHLFCKTNTQKMVAKVKNLHTEEKPSFVYLRIRVSGQRNHSLICGANNRCRKCFYLSAQKEIVVIL
jgi:hypothetical protein